MIYKSQIAKYLGNKKEKKILIILIKLKERKNNKNNINMFIKLKSYFPFFLGSLNLSSLLLILFCPFKASNIFLIISLFWPGATFSSFS